MKITKHNNVFQLTFIPRLFPVNCYLVEEEDSLTLIDAALPYSVKGIMQAASKIGKPISRIILTHAHDDHVGALDSLKQLIPEATVYISKRDAKLLAGDRSIEPDEAQLLIKGGVPTKVKTTPDHLLNDGDRIGSLLAISAPGHTPGSMAFLDTRDRAMIAGDAFQTRGGIAVTGQLVPLFPFPAMATWNKEAAIQSAVKLLSYEPTVLAVGHGRMVVEPKKAIADAIARAQKNNHTVNRIEV